MTLMEEEFENLERLGANTEILSEVADEFSYNIRHSNNDLDTSLNKVVTNIQSATKEFIDTKNEYGIDVTNAVSTTLYVPDLLTNTELYLTFLASGKSKVDRRTCFDVASITKIYTLLLAYRLEELGFLSFEDKVADLNPKFSGLEDFTIEDLVMLHGEMRTLGNIADSTTELEARNILNTLYLTNKDRDKNKYTDFGAIALGETMVCVVNNKTGFNYNFQTLMKEYLLEPLCIYPEDTTFNPISNNILGQGDNTNQVHDPKTRILGNATGSSGIFTNGHGIAVLANRMFNADEYCDFYESACTKEQLLDMAIHTYPNSSEPHKGLLGIYLKHPKGGDSFAPKAYSNLVFAHQGFTGSLAIFDPLLHIHNSILVDSVTKEKNRIGYGTNQKPIGFMDAFDKYEDIITKETLVAMLVKRYYEKRNQETHTIHKTYSIDKA